MFSSVFSALHYSVNGPNDGLTLFYLSNTGLVPLNLIPSVRSNQNKFFGPEVGGLVVSAKMLSPVLIRQGSFGPLV